MWTGVHAKHTGPWDNTNFAWIGEPSVARRFKGFARAHGGFDPVQVAPAAFDPPVHDGPKHPLTGRHRHEPTRRWSAGVAAADAGAFAVPEYDDVPPSAS